MTKLGTIALELGMALLNVDAVRKRLVAEKSASFQLRRMKIAQIHVKQFEETAKGLEESIAPVIVAQVDSITTGLEGKTPKESESNEEIANDLIERVYNPREWDDKIVNAVLPVLAVGMAEAIVSFFQELGVDILKAKRVTTKATTATEWLEDHQDDWAVLVEAVEAEGLPIQIMTEMPPDMREVIQEQLGKTFKQDYWKVISDTTGGDAEVFLRQGLDRGWSINRMASEIAPSLQGEGTAKYAKQRAKNIARTESGNALNSARKAAGDKLQEELPELPMKQSWMSVLGDTTRDTHADLDGVPEDEEGLWNLAGYMVPWPSHYSLPAQERCNCLCSILTEFGMQDAEAQQLLDEYAERVGEE